MEETPVYTNSKTSDTDNEDYYQSTKEEGSDNDSSPIKTLNVITNRNQKEFLLDLIGKISDDETKNEDLEKT